METKRPTNPAAEEILNLYFPVLDNGFISLCDYMGTDQCIESAARVSYGAGTRKVNQTRGLIRYLKRHNHNTPIEQVELKFHISMPIFVMRQLIRTRTASTNETSGRYSLLPLLFYTPDEKNFNYQSKTNNQGRGQLADNEKYKAAIERWEQLRKDSSGLYEDLVEADIARELARIDLPLSVYTSFYWKINLHNLLRFLSLRVDSHAQWEIQEYGKIMAGMVKRVAPLMYEAWIDYDVCGAHLSRMELDILRNLLVHGKSQQGTKYIGTEMSKRIYENEADIGLSTRELNEFISKLKNKNIPDFELDLSMAKPASYFEQKMLEAVPQIDKERS